MNMNIRLFEQINSPSSTKDSPDGESFVLEAAGKHYIEEVKRKCYWEVVVKDNEVLIIERGGPLEPIVLTVGIENGRMMVEDWWGWGCG